MKRRILLAAGCAVVLVASAFAQAGGGTGDPVTGTWGADGMSFLELKYDGKAAVTGTTIWRPGRGEEHRAPIETGTFDRQTGALKLAGSVKNRAGETVSYLVEGKIEGNTVSGTYHVGEDKGDFTFSRQGPGA